MWLRRTIFRRRLTVCPILEGEEQLRLLNFQHNAIQRMEHLSSLRRLIFLDLYDNRIEEISGLSTLKSLRVLMLGKNRWNMCGNNIFKGSLTIANARKILYIPLVLTIMQKSFPTCTCFFVSLLQWSFMCVIQEVWNNLCVFSKKLFSHEKRKQTRTFYVNPVDQSMIMKMYS